MEPRALATVVSVCRVKACHAATWLAHSLADRDTGQPKSSGKKLYTYLHTFQFSQKGIICYFDMLECLFGGLSLRHQESNSSLCMTLIVCKDCFFYFLKCLQPSRVFSAFPLHSALFTVFFRYFLFWGRQTVPFKDRTRDTAQGCYTTG